MRALRRAWPLLLSLAIAPAGCGARSDLAQPAAADASAPTTPEDACVLGGGTWEMDGCDGHGGECNIVVCLDAFGDGCHCPAPRCWDGARCVSGLDAG
jgi:hypothetical protein